MKCHGAKKYQESWFVLKLLYSFKDKMPKEGGTKKGFRPFVIRWNVVEPKIPRKLVYSLTFVVCQRQDVEKGGTKIFLDHLSLDERSWSLKIPRMLVILKGSNLFLSVKHKMSKNVVSLMPCSSPLKPPDYYYYFIFLLLLFYRLKPKG